MERNLVDTFAEQLRKQRKHYLDEFRKAEEDLESIAAERESELEEHAQEEQSARVLTHLDDRTLQAVHEVDAALQRILDGVYGKCETCGGSIAVDRLRTLPATRHCTDCEAQYEKQTIAAAEEIETLSTPPVPQDLSLLGDAELVEAIRELLKEDGRIDTEELRIVCRKRVVYLTGALPSEAEHQILLKIVTDVLGLSEIVDRIQVEELLWEREDRSKETPPELPAAGTEDIAESTEEDKEFVAPAKPTPEEE
jgi:RNA polymerase-binding protein DksA